MPNQPTQRANDLTAFVAVLFVGVTLIMSRAASVQDMAVVSSALGGLYSIWHKPLARLP